MAERWRQNGWGGTSLAKAPRSSGQTQHFAERPCHRHDVTALTRNEGLEPLGEFDAAILSVSHYVSPGSRVSWLCRVWSAGHGRTRSPSESEPVVNHHGKADGKSRRRPQISRRNAHLTHSRAPLQTHCLSDRIKLHFYKWRLFWLLQRTRSTSEARLKSVGKAAFLNLFSWK